MFNTRAWALAGAIAGFAVFGMTAVPAGAEPLPAPPTPSPVNVVAPAAPASSALAPATVMTPPATAVTPPATVMTPAAPALTPATSGTIAEFLTARGVQLVPQSPTELTALNVTLPVPTGWTRVPDPNVPDAFVVIADRAGGDGTYTSNAQVIVYRLVGDFDPLEAISHGFIDSQALPNWQPTDGSFSSFGGFPSSLIEGTFRENELILNTSRRHVIATAGADRFLVSLSVNTAVNQAVAAAEATDGVVNGFRVTAAAPAPGPLPDPAAPGPAAGLPSPATPAAALAAPSTVAPTAAAAPVS